MCVCQRNFFGSACELNATQCATKYCPVAGTHCVWEIHYTAIRCACPAGQVCGGKRDFCASQPCRNGERPLRLIICMGDFRFDGPFFKPTSFMIMHSVGGKRRADDSHCCKVREPPGQSSGSGKGILHKLMD